MTSQRQRDRIRSLIFPQSVQERDFHHFLDKLSSFVAATYFRPNLP